MNADNPTVLVIKHTIKPGNEQRFEKWLAEILKAVSASPGYLGREVFPPDAEGKPYLSIVRFKTKNDLQNWLDSPERNTFIEEIRDILQEGDKTSVKAGIDVWFTPAQAAKPKPYKQFLITAAVVYPLTQIIPRLLSPMSESIPFLKHRLVSGLIVVMIMTGLMTYVIMPHLTYWLHDWLYESAENK